MDLPTPRLRPPDRPPAADASVRAATAADAGGMGAAQAAAWRASYGGVLPADTVAALTPEALAEVWRDALVRPPSGAHRVLVALAADRVVGFTAVGPAGGDRPEVGELLALEVTPEAQRGGHGSRLLNAAADRLRDVGFEQVVVWVLDGDEVRLGFFTTAGFAPDGARRGFAPAGGAELHEVRLVATLGPA